MTSHASPLLILSHICHPAVTDGFLPAAQRLGVPVLLLTDHRRAHLEHFRHHPPATPVQVLECDVFNPLSVLDLLDTMPLQPRAVFSNSDHLQTSTALVATALGVPGKDWRICYAAKNKAAMRQRLRAHGLPTPWFFCLPPGAAPPTQAPWPLIAKPREGVASQDVRHCADAATLQAYLDDLWQRHPHRSVLLESVLDGPLFTLETLGDGQQLQALGGFDVRLSSPPYFVECEAHWRGAVDRPVVQQALVQLQTFGVGFGACHSEFILTADGPILVEINYRSIGDGREFLLDRMFGGHWFNSVLGLHLGQPLPTLRAHREHALVRYYVAQREGILTLASADQSCSDTRWEAHYRCLRQPGQDIRLSHSNKDYLGALHVLADAATDLQHALASAEAPLQWHIDATAGARQ
ncbi:ATP-grasp domain-containing protein [Xanthomonas albilineans]|uniref:ATP-grasp domain-containing protein n=1 Tax=Xanthomonas albilineans TaxID=29447 RepID=UPI0005F3143E|nr:carboxylate--amine ligase [Xanthomonas albilineans]